MIGTRMDRRVLIFAGAMLAASVVTPARADDGTAPPDRRVVAAYFHRTERCPTCLKVGSFIEQVIKQQFPAELQDGRLTTRQVDFQAPANASYVSAFGITGPAFLILVVENNQVVAWKPAPKTWALLGDPPAFSRYIEAEVNGVLPSGSSAPTVSTTGSR